MIELFHLEGWMEVEKCDSLHMEFFMKILSLRSAVLIVVPENINTSPKDGSLVFSPYPWNLD